MLRVGVVGSSICVSAIGVSLSMVEGVAACISTRVHPAAIVALLRSALPLAISAAAWGLVIDISGVGRK